MKLPRYLTAVLVGVFAFSFFSVSHVSASGSCASNGTGTDWFTAADWTGTCTGAGGVPGVGDNVTITSGDPITLASGHGLPFAVGTLTVNDVFDDTVGFLFTANNIVIGSGGNFKAGASNIYITGTSGTLLAVNAGGTFTPGTSTVNVSGNGNATIAAGSPTFYNLTSSGTGTKSQGSAITFAIGGTFSVTNGTFSTPGTAITANGSNTLSVTNATVNAATAFEMDYPFATKTLGTGSTVNYNEAGAQTVYQGVTYYNLLISGSFTKSLSGATTATNSVTVQSGTFDTAGQTLTTGSITTSGGSLTLGSSTVNLTGTTGTLMTINGGTYSPGTSTVNMTGNGNAALISGGVLSFYNLTSSGTGTKSLGGGFGIATGGTVSITNGTFDPGTNQCTGNSGTTLSVTNATLDIGASTFANNFSGFPTVSFGTGSTVNYDRAGTQAIDNTHPYYNLTISGGPKEADFATSGTTTVSNVFTANGTSGNLINLFSPSVGTSWTFAPLGTTAISYVAVRDGACGTGAPTLIAETNLTDLGNNGTCWVAAVAVTPVVARRAVNIVHIMPGATLGQADFAVGSSTVSAPAVPFTLLIDPTTVRGYAVSLNPDFSGATMRQYVSSSDSIALPSVPGSYKIYLEYFSPTGDRSSVISHTVTYSPNGASAAAQQGTAAVRSLAMGSQGADVTALQKVLVQDGELALPQSSVYGYFGSKTRSALQAFQMKYGIATSGSAGYGVYGPKTQAKVSALQDQAAQ